MSQLRLKPEQLEQRQAAEEELQQIKTELGQEEDPTKQDSLKAELATRQEKLDTLLEGFQVLRTPTLRRLTLAT